MSNWTHVAAIIRIDAFRFEDEEDPNFDELIGFEFDPFDENEDKCWMDVEVASEDFLPMGSEGSLNKSVWINPSMSSIAAYTISIFGDLRDHDDPNKIIEWFKKKCESLNVRQAVITASNELNGEVTWTYKDPEE